MNWKVWCPELGEGPEQAKEFSASTAMRAAELWAEQHDDCQKRSDPKLVDGSRASLKVYVSQGGAVQYHFSVCGRRVPRYFAYQLPNPPLEWSHLDKFPESTCTCLCGNVFRSHARAVTDPSPYIAARKPCPGCGSTMLQKVSSDPESYTLEGSSEKKSS